MTRLYLLVVILILAGCATKVVSIYNYSNTNKNPSTFFVSPSSEYASLSLANKKIDSLLQKVISKTLGLKGLKVSSLPDLYVSYIINVHTSSETQTESNYPYDRYNYSYYQNFSTRNYKEGVLIIDIKDNRGKLIWQGSKSFKIHSKQSVEELLPEICQEIITTYKINPDN
jgi:hypothetical protein